MLGHNGLACTYKRVGLRPTRLAGLRPARLDDVGTGHTTEYHPLPAMLKAACAAILTGFLQQLCNSQDIAQLYVTAHK